MTNLPGIISDTLDEFGAQGQYVQHTIPDSKIRAGFAPLETLPAEWYNTYLRLLDKHINQLQTLVVQIQVELSNIIATDTSATPSATVLNQVLTAINKLIDAATPRIATGNTAGVVKSSSVRSKVTVNADGTMTPNALSDWTSASSVLQILNNKKNLQDAVQDPIASSTAIEFISSLTQDIYGVITPVKSSIRQATTNQTGVTQLDQSFSANSVKAASAVLTAALRQSLGTFKVIAATSTTSTTAVTSGGTYLNLIYCPPASAGGVQSYSVLSSTPISALAGMGHATSATYLRPAGSTSTLVTADAQGNLKAHTLELT